MSKRDDNARSMDAVAQALMVAAVSIAAAGGDERLAELREVNRKADTLGFLIVPALDFGASMDRLRDQRELLQWAEDSLALYNRLAERHNQPPLGVAPPVTRVRTAAGVVELEGDLPPLTPPGDGTE